MPARTTVLAAGWVSRRHFASITAIGIPLAAAFAAGHAAAQPAALVGVYDGGQMELAAGLELGADGRFRYALSYGALDEQAAGRWSASGDRVLLTSNPVVAPRFVLVARSRGPSGLLQLDIQVPNSLSRQYFTAFIAYSDGRMQRAQLSESGLALPVAADNPPVGLRLWFPVFNIIGEPLPLDPHSGYSIQYRFEPNDLGKVDFQAEPLRLVNGDLILDRHVRTIRFRRIRQ